MEQDLIINLQTVELLGKSGSMEVLPQLLQLAEEQDEKLRAAAIRALCFLILRYRESESEAIRSLQPYLMKALQDPYPGVRQEALTALGHLDEPATLRAMVHCLQDRDEEVRATAEWVLDQIE